MALTRRVAGVSSIFSGQRPSVSGSRCTHESAGEEANISERLVPYDAQSEEENFSVSSNWTATHGFGSGIRYHVPPLTTACSTGAMATMHCASSPTMQS